MSERPGPETNRAAEVPELTITIDAGDPEALAGFWAEALGARRQ